MRLKLFLLSCLLLGGVFLAAGQARAAGLMCLPPTPLQPTVNKLTGQVMLQWTPVIGVQTYFIEVYTASSLTPLKTYTVAGSFTTFVIPDEDLACGNYKYRVKAECCDDRCDKCSDKFDPKKDYCSNMATLWQDPCACPDPYYSGAVQYSFSFMCSDGSKAGYLCDNGSTPIGGVCSDLSTPQFRSCPLGTEVFGCNWECSPRTHYAPKSCGSDYEVACGQGPNKQLVSEQPSYNLCSIKGPFGWSFNDKFLKIPPGVTEGLPSLIYNWQCGAGAKISDQCLACRRAECGSPQGQVYQGALPTDKLCLSADGTKTGEVANLIETADGWTWDCQGRTECDISGATNKNWTKVWNGETKDPTPNTWKQLNKCSALKAACGQANGGFYIRDNFATKATAKNFLCKGQGKAVGVYSPGKLYDEETFFEEKNFDKIVSDRMLWQCWYNQGTPEEATLDCSAYVVGCRSDIIGNNYTQGSFDSLTKDVPAPANLCYNGKDDRANDSQVTLGWPSAINPLGFNWTCSDLHGGQDKCQANLVACKPPPHKGNYKDEQELMADAPLCTAGESSSLFETLDGATLTGWTWWCQDDIGNRESCQADTLRCQTPPNKGFFNGWADFQSQTGAKCPGTLDMRECTGVCSNLASKIWVKYNPDSRKWNWDCGSDKCSAAKNACLDALPNKGYYADLAELAQEVTTQGGQCRVDGTGKYWCLGVCANKDKEVEIVHDLTANKFVWHCGDETCEAKEMGCGKLVGQNSPLTKTIFDKYVNNSPETPFDGPSSPYPDYSPDFSLCMNGGTVEWYAKAGVSNTIGVGWTDYWAGEFSDWVPFVDHDRQPRTYIPNNFKGGAPLWRCVYNGKTIPTKSGAYVYEQDRAFYCYAWEQGVCADVLVSETDWKNNTGKNSNKYTLNEIRAMAADGNNRGNPSLCSRGIVWDGLDVNGNPMLDNHFRCGGVNPGDPNDISYDQCLYKCEGGMNKHGAADVSCQNIDVAACRKSDGLVGDAYKGPHLGTYADQAAFDRAWNSPATDNPQIGGCEKGDATKGPTLNEDTCQWTWECDDNGIFNCHATRQGKFIVPNISGATPICAKDKNSYTIDKMQISGCDPANVSIAWSLTPTSPPLTGSGDSFEIPAETLRDGVYTLTAVVSCSQAKCLDAPTVTKTKIITVANKPQRVSVTGVPDKILCQGVQQNITATATTDCKIYTLELKLINDADQSVMSSVTAQSAPAFLSIKDLPAGTYHAEYTLDCLDNTCVTPDPLSDRTKSFAIKQSDTQTVAVTGLPAADICQGADQNIRATADTTCSQYTLTLSILNRNNQEVASASADNQPVVSISVKDLPAGVYHVKYNLKCHDDPICVEPDPAANSNAGSFTIKASKDWSINRDLTGDAAFCAGQAKKYDLSVNNCLDYATTWTFLDEKGFPANGSGTKDFYTTDKDLPVGKYTLMASVMCRDDCAKPDTALATNIKQIEMKAPTEQFATVAGVPNDLCQKQDGLITATATTDCKDYTLELRLVNNSTGQVTTATADNDGVSLPPLKNLAPGNYRVEYTLTCNDDSCVTPNPKIDNNVGSFTVFDCSCDGAHTKNFVDISEAGAPPLDFCQSGCAPGLDEPKLKTDGTGWTWQCYCGSNKIKDDSQVCYADKTECGPASGPSQIYTKDSWNALNIDQKCKNGSAGAVNDLDKVSEVNENNACTNAINDTRDWSCLDDAGQTTPTCSNKILDCGIADANRILLDASGCNQTLQPYDTVLDLYSGSYSNDPDTGHRCNWGEAYVTNVQTLEANKRGKYYWECGADSAGNTLKCEARRDCGWMDRVGCNNDQRLATVNYGAAGCWTAEDVGTCDTNAKDMTWGKATRIPSNETDVNACSTSAPYWVTSTSTPGCKGVHCFSLLNSSNDCYKKGVCGNSGFFVPTDTEWHTLENQLANGNACSMANNVRINGLGNNSCLPAGQGNVATGFLGFGEDGLQDRVTFAGESGIGYWTNSQKRSPITSPFCVGSTCPLTLPYYEIEDTRWNPTNDRIARDADSGNINCGQSGQPACTEHRVRCYQLQSASSINKGDGSNQIPRCYGWGCLY